MKHFKHDDQLLRCHGYSLHYACFTCRKMFNKPSWARRLDDLKRVCQFMQSGKTFPAGCAEIDSVFHVSDVPYVWSRLEKR